jgi:hypothetical protein
MKPLTAVNIWTALTEPTAEKMAKDYIRIYHEILNN